MIEHVPDKLKPVAKRYTREMIIASLLYTAVVFAGASATRMDVPHWVIVDGGDCAALSSALDAARVHHVRERHR